MHQKSLFYWKLDKELMLNEIAEAEEEILKYSLMAKAEPTSEETKKGYEKINGLIKGRINELKRKIEATESQEKALIEKIYNIEDQELKEMAKAYFIDGLSCEEIGRKYYLERTTVYKRLKRYFDD